MYSIMKLGLTAAYGRMYGPGQPVEQELPNGIRYYVEPTPPGTPGWELLASQSKDMEKNETWLNGISFFKERSNLLPHNAEVMLSVNGNRAVCHYQPKTDFLETMPYIRRAADDKLMQALFASKRSLVCIQTSHERGKTRLMRRALLTLKRQCYSTVYLDFAKTGEQLDRQSLYQWFTFQISGQVGIEIQPKMWNGRLPEADAFRRYLQQVILPKVQGLAIGLDNIDCLLDMNGQLGTEFVQFIRCLYEDESELSTIKFLLSHTEETLALEGSQPFNAGTTVRDGKLDATEVAMLGQLYLKRALNDQETIEVLKNTKGGHPPLVHHYFKNSRNALG